MYTLKVEGIRNTFYFYKLSKYKSNIFDHQCVGSIKNYLML